MKRLIVLLTILGLGGSIAFLIMGKFVEAIVLFVGSVVPLILAAVFGYPQYQSAKEARIPVATLEIKDEGLLAARFLLILHNHCNQTISARFYPSATMSGRQASLNTPIPEEPIEIKPSEHRKIYDFEIGTTIVRNTNYMNHQNWLYDEESDCNRAVERMTVEASSEPRKANNLFRFKITVHYRGLITGLEGNPISKEYYYDFHRRRLIDTSLLNLQITDV